MDKSLDRANALGDQKADGHGRIEMSAGDVAERGNHNADGQTMGQRDAEETEAAGAVQVLVRADRAGAKKNQRKRAEKFRDQLLRWAVHRGSSTRRKESAPDSNGG